MKELNIEELQQLIAEKKWGHVKQLLKEYVTQPMDEMDRAALATELTTALMVAEGSALRKYNNSLEIALGMLRDIGDAERKLVNF